METLLPALFVIVGWLLIGIPFIGMLCRFTTRLDWFVWVYDPYNSKPNKYTFDRSAAFVSVIGWPFILFCILWILTLEFFMAVFKPIVNAIGWCVSWFGDKHRV